MIPERAPVGSLAHITSGKTCHLDAKNGKHTHTHTLAWGQARARVATRHEKAKSSSLEAAPLFMPSSSQRQHAALKLGDLHK